MDGQEYRVTDRSPLVTYLGPYNDRIRLDICDGIAFGDSDVSGAVTLGVNSGDRVWIAKDRIVIKARKDNILSKEIVIYCKNIENTGGNQGVAASNKEAI